MLKLQYVRTFPQCVYSVEEVKGSFRSWNCGQTLTVVLSAFLWMFWSRLQFSTISRTHTYKRYTAKRTKRAFDQCSNYTYNAIYYTLCQFISLKLLLFFRLQYSFHETHSITVTHSLRSTFSFFIQSIIKVGIVGIIVFVNIILVTFGFLIGVGVVLIAVIVVVIAALVVGPGTAHNGLADATNPVVLFRLGIGIQQIAGFGRGDFERVSLFGFEVGGFDSRTVRQVHHAVRTAGLVFAEKELVAF